MKPLSVSNELMDDTAGLRARAERDGYLFFEQVMDVGAIDSLRVEICEILERHGWLDEGTEPIDARSRRDAIVEGVRDYYPVYDDIQCLESFHALPHEPELLAALERLFGEAVLVQPRHVGRVIFPTTPATPPHQDFVHIQGTPETWSGWIPLGDVPISLGGLAVQAASHTAGLLQTKPMRGAGGVGVEIDTQTADWHASDMRAGDILLFHSHTVHRGLPNQTEDRIRLSMDVRYQAASQPIERGALGVHHNRLSWDQVYEGWASDRFQRYWEQFDLEVVERDPNAGRGYNG